MKRYWKYLIIIIIFVLIFIFAVSRTTYAAETRYERNTLQDMIDSASGGDTLQLEPKEYSGPLRINKSLKIIGNGCIISGSGKEDIIELLADGIELIDINVMCTESIDNEDKAGILIKSNNNVIRDCNIEQLYYGLHFEDSKGNQVIENVVHGDPSESIAEKGAGILLEYATGNTFKGNNISNVCDGIYFYYSNDNLLIDNYVTESRYAFHLMDESKRNNIYCNELCHNITGIMTMLAQDTTISRNYIYNQYDYHGVGIIVYDCENTLITENVISDNAYGIEMMNTAGTTIKMNRIVNNSIGLLMGYGLTGNEIYENNFIGNVRQMSVQNAGKISLYTGKRGNYWDDYSGFDTTGDGIGGKPYYSGNKYFEYIVSLREELQIFFNSPSMVLLDMVKDADDEYETADKYPLTTPLEISELQAGDNMEDQLQVFYILLAAFLLTFGCLTFYFTRKKTW